MLWLANLVSNHKEKVHPKITILPTFTNPHVDPNLYDYFCCQTEQSQPRFTFIASFFPYNQSAWLLACLSLKKICLHPKRQKAHSKLKRSTADKTVLIVHTKHSNYRVQEHGAATKHNIFLFWETLTSYDCLRKGQVHLVNENLWQSPPVSALPIETRNTHNNEGCGQK